MQQDASPDFVAEALDDDIFQWLFAVRGPPDTEFEVRLTTALRVSSLYLSLSGACARRPRCVCVLARARRAPPSHTQNNTAHNKPGRPVCALLQGHRRRRAAGQYPDRV